MCVSVLLVACYAAAAALTCADAGLSVGVALRPSADEREFLAALAAAILSLKVLILAECCCIAGAVSKGDQPPPPCQHHTG